MEKDDLPDEEAMRDSGPSSSLVIVDTRDLRSTLPYILYRSAFHVEPVTLEIGDYLLTRDICVERKSIPDLIGSLSSGRLFAQIDAMCRAYAKPVLLIEFDRDRPFHLMVLPPGHAYLFAGNDDNQGRGDDIRSELAACPAPPALSRPEDHLVEQPARDDAHL